MKYEEWLNEWLQNYVEPTSKIKTYQRYSEISFRHIIPRLGNYDLTDITPSLLQRHVAELLKSGNIKTGSGLSPNTVNSIITVLQNSLKTANLVYDDISHVYEKIKRPKICETKISCFSLEEQKLIENYIKSKRKIKLYGVILCLYTGLRIGELIALEWTDFNFERAELNINKTCHYGKNKKGVYSRLIDTTKTASSTRIIPLPRQILPLIKEMKKTSKSKFVISNGEKPISTRSYQRSFSLLLKRLNIPHRGFHSLRHTFATRALECGIDVKTLSEILGHKSPTITLNRYVHSLPEHKRDMMNRLGKLF